MFVFYRLSTIQSIGIQYLQRVAGGDEAAVQAMVAASVLFAATHRAEMFLKLRIHFLGGNCGSFSVSAHRKSGGHDGTA